MNDKNARSKSTILMLWCKWLSIKQQNTNEGIRWFFQQNIRGQKGTLEVPLAFQYSILPSLQKNLQQTRHLLLTFSHVSSLSEMAKKTRCIFRRANSTLIRGHTFTSERSTSLVIEGDSKNSSILKILNSQRHQQAQKLDESFKTNVNTIWQ
jgi:hypothetical protein